MPRADHRLRRHRVGRGDERIGAVVDVEHGGLRALEQDALAGGAQPVEPLPHILGEGQDLGRELEQVGRELGGIDQRLAQPLAQRIVVRQQRVHLHRRA